MKYFKNFEYPLNFTNDIEILDKDDIINIFKSKLDNINKEIKELLILKLILKKRKFFMDNEIEKEITERFLFELSLTDDDNMKNLLEECINEYDNSEEEIDIKKYLQIGKDMGIEDRVCKYIINKINDIIKNGKKELDISNCILNIYIVTLNENEMIYLMGFINKLRNIEILNLEGCKIGDKGIIELFDNINNFNNISEIYIRGCNIENDGIDKLSDNLKYITNLSILDIGCNKFDDAGINKLSDNLSYVKKLSFLNISENRIGDEGIKSLTKSFKYISDLSILIMGSINIIIRLWNRR